MRIGEYPPQGADLHDITLPGVGTPPTPEADADSAERQALAALGFSKPLIAMMQDRATSNGTSVEAELLHSGHVQEEAYYGAMARLLRLPFLDRIDPKLVTDDQGLDSQLVRPTMLRLTHRYRTPELAIVPEAARLAELAAAILTRPPLGRDLAITTPGAIRKAAWASGASRRVREAAGALSDSRPDLSARTVMTGGQGFAAGALIAGMASLLLIAPLATLMLLHVVLSLTYLASLALRIFALGLKMRGVSPSITVQAGRAHRGGQLPRYTVLVALYREAAMAEQIVTALKRLDWPASLLDIKLVCEADDAETIAALEAVGLPAQFEIVAVPPSGPRTKPKALTYALSAARGEFLAIYDAEDRPHPQQLREAYLKFASGPPELACLQAPLIITNARASWLAALFSLEYSALFRGVLPMLARHGMPLPLGGTSNHFRTEALKAAGGWDPYNVTEDADMGLRLHRLGYRADVISRQTLEDAPVEIDVWAAQRARWFKGWLQTWLVLMRDPATLLRQIGLPAFIVFHLMVGGLLISALLHPLIFVVLWLGAAVLMEAPKDDLPLAIVTLFIIDFVNIVGSYLTFVGLGVGSMIDHEKRLLGWRWVFVPFYWLMISAASWRALIELKTKPFHWNKTPHQPSRQAPGHDGRVSSPDVK